MCSDPVNEITKMALERNEEKWTEYAYRMGMTYLPDQLVFIDESSFDRRASSRTYGYAPKGYRARQKSFFIRGKRYGTSYCHSRVPEHSYHLFPAIPSSLPSHSME